MHELEIHNEHDPKQIASIIFGNQLIEDNSPNDDPYTGAWVILPKIKSEKITQYKNTPFVNQEESDTLIIDLPENN